MKMKGYVLKMFYLTAENYGKVQERISKIRKEYPVMKHKLCSLFDEANEELCKMSEYISRSEIEDGKRFGVFTLSQSANAFNPSGSELRSHGDVYLILWTYNKEKDLFYCEDAWGGSHFEKDPTRYGTTPLIETDFILA